MSEQNTEDQAGVAAVANSAATEAQAKMYATRSECEANKPADAPKSLKPFEVLHNGTSKGGCWRAATTMR